MSVAAPRPSGPSVAAPRPSPAPRPAEAPRRRPRGVPAPAARTRRVTLGGAAWVLLLALLLGGIVALNVAALRDSIALNRLEAREQTLRSRSGELAAEVGRLSAPSRVAFEARRLHMVLADPAETRYVRFGSGHAGSRPHP